MTGSATTRYRHRATDPLRSDSARDGLKDGVEAKGFVNKVWHKVFESTPLKTDSDRDGLRDKVGVTVRRTRSTVTSRPTRSTAIPTTEARPDGTEIRNGSNPAKRGA